MNSNTAKARNLDAVVPLPPAPSGAGVDVLVLTEDDFFLLAVRKVVALPNRIWHATSETQAADLLISTPCAVALLDTGLMQSNLPATIARLHQQFPDLAFVLAGEAQDEAPAAPLLESGQVRAFVIKQYAGRRLGPALQTGVDCHLDLRSETAQHKVRSGWRRPPVLVGIAAGVLAAAALVAAAIWLMTSGDRQVTGNAAQAPVTPVVASDSPETSPALEMALEQARQAFEAGHYVSAAGNTGALEHFRAALALDPLNAEARDGLSRIAEIMLARTELALVEGNTGQAADMLKAAKAIDPANPRIEFLHTQISREVTRTSTAREEAEQIEALNQRLEELSKARTTQISAAAPEKAPPAVNPAPQRRAAEADRLLALGYERLTQGRLLQPEQDNAPHYLLKLQQLQPDHPGLQPAIAAVRERLLVETDSALAERNVTIAQGLLDAARSLGASGARVDKLSADVRRSRTQAQLLATPSPLLPDMIARQHTPNYPLRARRENVEGYVDLRFTVSAKGEVQEVEVVSAQPQGYFEEEAVRAAKRWKIKPRIIDGDTYEQLLSLRLRFTLE